MSATLRRRCADITSAGLRCKDTTKFADVQILSGKSFRSFKVLRVNGAMHLLFRV